MNTHSEITGSQAVYQWLICPSVRSQEPGLYTLSPQELGPAKNEKMVSMGLRMSPSQALAQGGTATSVTLTNCAQGWESFVGKTKAPINIVE